MLWIGLLVVFEATVGVLVLIGGRRTQLGYAAVLAFYLALTLFGGFELRLGVASWHHRRPRAADRSSSR